MLLAAELPDVGRSDLAIITDVEHDAGHPVACRGGQDFSKNARGQTFHASAHIGKGLDPDGVAAIQHRLWRGPSGRRQEVPPLAAEFKHPSEISFQ